MQLVLTSGPFRALRHKNYRYYWFGQAISVIGSWMQNMAMQWLALELTNSALLLSIVTAVEQVPVMIFFPFCRCNLGQIAEKKSNFDYSNPSFILCVLTVFDYIHTCCPVLALSCVSSCKRSRYNI